MSEVGFKPFGYDFFAEREFDDDTHKLAQQRSRRIDFIRKQINNLLHVREYEYTKNLMRFHMETELIHFLSERHNEFKKGLESMLENLYANPDFEVTSEDLRPKRDLFLNDDFALIGYRSEETSKKPKNEFDPFGNVWVYDNIAKRVLE